VSGPGGPGMWDAPGYRPPAEPDEEKPIAATVLTLIGGVLILGVGLVVASVGSTLASVGVGVGGALGALGALAVLLGIILLGLAVQLYRNPDSHTGYGIAIIVLSLLSIVGGGGAIIGLILGLVGGILAVVFHPSDEMEPFPDVRSRSQGIRYCPSCGKAQDEPWGTRFCSHCGAPL
jgi:hypothetical protein